MLFSLITWRCFANKYYTERREGLVASSKWHSLGFTTLTIIHVGRGLGKFIIGGQICGELYSFLQSGRGWMRSSRGGWFSGVAGIACLLGWDFGADDGP